VVFHGFSMSGFLWGNALQSMDKDPTRFGGFKSSLKAQVRTGRAEARTGAEVRVSSPDARQRRATTHSGNTLTTEHALRRDLTCAPSPGLEVTYYTAPPF